MKDLEGFKFSSRIEVSDELANKLALIPTGKQVSITRFHYAAAAIALLVSINIFAVLYANQTKETQNEDTEYFEEWN